MVARDVTARIVRRSRQLAVPPLIGRRLPEYPHADLRELMERPFRIIYLVKPDRVEIVTINTIGRTCHAARAVSYLAVVHEVERSGRPQRLRDRCAGGAKRRKESAQQSDATRKRGRDRNQRGRDRERVHDL